MFSDGKERVVRSNDLISGAAIANIANAAKERAVVREIDRGVSGVRLEDILTAVDNEMEQAARALSPRNCANVLTDIPQDVHVVSVEPVKRKVKREYRYVEVA